MSRKKLTIAIPTYNRSNYLDRCLGSIFDNIKGYENDIEILIANNASTDDTSTVIDKYINLGFNFRYHVHESNCGLEGNLYFCFHNSNGNYLWIIGDDDFLLPGAFKEIHQYILGDYGVIYLNNYWYKTDIFSEKPTLPDQEATIFKDANLFLQKASFYLTFVTANIVNKSYFDNTIDLEVYRGTYLVLVAWELSIALSAPRNVYVNNQYIAALSDNSGGYHVYEVFSKHMNRIMGDFTDRGLKRQTINAINTDLITNFFPGVVALSKQNKMASFSTNSALRLLFDHYKTYPIFWYSIMPQLLFPQPFVVFLKNIKKVFSCLIGHRK